MRAAVLVPLFLKEGRLHLLFIKRAEEVEHHKGQISFPGGAIEESDESPLHAALREAWEEVGIEPRDVEILGELDDEKTLSGLFLISPFVGLIPHPYKFRLRPEEVAGVLEVPLRELANPANMRCEERDGVRTYSFKVGDEVIWGATARIVKKFIDLILPALGSSL